MHNHRIDNMIEYINISNIEATHKMNENKLKLSTGKVIYYDVDFSNELNNQLKLVEDGLTNIIAINIEHWNASRIVQLNKILTTIINETKKFKVVDSYVGAKYEKRTFSTTSGMFFTKSISTHTSIVANDYLNIVVEKVN